MFPIESPSQHNLIHFLWIPILSQLPNLLKVTQCTVQLYNCTLTLQDHNKVIWEKLYLIYIHRLCPDLYWHLHRSVEISCPASHDPPLSLLASRAYLSYTGPQREIPWDKLSVTNTIAFQTRTPVKMFWLTFSSSSYTTVRPIWLNDFRWGSGEEFRCTQCW